jgi:hypothetical protein
MIGVKGGNRMFEGWKYRSAVIKALQQMLESGVIPFRVQQNMGAAAFNVVNASYGRQVLKTKAAANNLLHLKQLRPP